MKPGLLTGTMIAAMAAAAFPQAHARVTTQAPLSEVPKRTQVSKEAPDLVGGSALRHPESAIRAGSPTKTAGGDDKTWIK